MGHACIPGFQSSGKELSTAPTTLEFSTGCLEYAACLQQHETVDRKIMLLGYCSTNRFDHLLRIELSRRHILMSSEISRSVTRIYFGKHNQLLLPLCLDGKGHTTTGTNRRMATFYSQFNILWIIVAPVKNQQILRASGDKE